MSDCEEDSGVHSQLHDERMDMIAENEGTGHSVTLFSFRTRFHIFLLFLRVECKLQ